jgi:arylsulfatase A-like enzyme
VSRFATAIFSVLLASSALAGRPEHFFVVSIDGLRSDLVDRAETPHLDLLVKSGTRARAARTVRPAVTLPAHASMLSGVTPERHGIRHNRHEPSRGRLEHDTLLSVAASQGRDVAAFVGKKKLLALLPQGGYRGGHVGYHDEPVMDRAVRELSRGLPHLTFIHLPGVDAAGHEHGWGSPQQVEAVAGADAQLGRLFRAIHAAGALRRTSFMVLADHGGHGTAHGVHHPLEFQIEWVAAGLGFQPGATIDAPVSVLDTMPTVLTVMGLQAPADIEGRVVTEALFYGDRDVDAAIPVQLGFSPSDLLPELSPAIGGGLAAPSVRLASRVLPRPRARPRPLVRVVLEPEDPAGDGLLPPFGQIESLARAGSL